MQDGAQHQQHNDQHADQQHRSFFRGEPGPGPGGIVSRRLRRVTPPPGPRVNCGLLSPSDTHHECTP
jgi:hypothetical protein